MFIYHLVNRFNDLQHLVIANLAVTVNVVKLERPVQFILHCAPRSNAECTDEFFKVNSARLIFVENIEYVISKGGGITIGEERSIYLLKFGLSEHAGRTVF